MEREFEEHLKKNGVSKKTIKALRKESVTIANTLLLFSDSDINKLCGQNKLCIGTDVLLKHIRDELKSTSSRAGTVSPFDRYIITLCR